MTNPNPNPQNRKSTRGRLLAMSSAAAIVVVGLGAFALLPQTHAVKVAADHPVRVAAEKSARAPRMLENSSPFSFADLVERVSPAVVSITSETMTTDTADVPDNIPAPFRDFFRHFNAPDEPHRAISAGSGFIIDKTGYIVTNNHVIAGGKKITVKLSDGRTFPAKLIGTDPATDIALLKIDSDKPLPSVEFGNDKQLRVGDWVIAVGNPFGLSNTVTAGIVSSLGRDISSPTTGNYNDFIQIDAPINRGNSGGPTFDLRGQVVGMNSMIFSPSGGSVGIGFAIPASTIHDVVAQLKAHGHVSRGWLGVEIQSVTPEIAASLGMKNSKGAIVASVVPNSPAAKGGFQQGDVITGMDGQTVDDNRDLTQRVALVPAGHNAAFTVLRGGKSIQIHVVIGNRPNQHVAYNAPSGPEAMAATGNAMGLGLAAVTPDARRVYNLDESVDGVVITKVDPSSDAAEKGLQPGDVVLKVGGRAVHTPQDVQAGVAAAKKMGRKSVLLLVARQQGGTGFVAVKVS